MLALFCSISTHCVITTQMQLLRNKTLVRIFVASYKADILSANCDKV